MPRWERRAVAEHTLKRNLTKRERQCMFKRQYTEEQAMYVARLLNKRQEDRVRAYRCDDCGVWHVGRYR